MIQLNLKALFFLIFVAAILVSCNTTSVKTQKPNIIFILSDDISWGDLSINGQKQFTTPNIDKLASEGIQFTNAYAGASACAPSRGSLMTGLHMGHCSIRCNRSTRGQDHLKDEDFTVAELMKNAGYSTCVVGKWGIGLPGTEGVPYKQGFDYSYGFYDQRRATGFYPNFLMENDKKVAFPENYGFDIRSTQQQTTSAKGMHTYDENGKLIPDGVKDPAKAINSQNYLHEKAIEFIKENHENPFFLYYSTQLPHGPCITPDIGKFKDKPWDQKHKEWAGMIDHLDRNVGEILKTLEDMGEADNTIIFFAGDNGYSHWGYFNRKPWEDDPIFKNKGPWPYGKFIPRDGGVRVPYFVYWPGKIQSGISNHITALYDFMATAGELAGANEFESDGISILPTLMGNPKKQQIHDYLYWENGSFGMSEQLYWNSHRQSLRMGDFFLFREHPDSFIEVYDLVKDLQCTNNLANEEKDMIQRAKQYMKEAHADSEWYVNPGESEKEIHAKRAKAEREGTLQESTWPNAKY